MSRDRARAVIGAAVLLLALAGCGPDVAMQELVQEMRAQRLQAQRLQEQLVTAAGREPSAVASEALAPLRSALDELAANQARLTAQQAQLTEDLGQWSKLLAQSMSGEPAEKAAQLALRLAQLEQTIAAQANEQAELEQLLGKALDRTATQLQAFVGRLEDAQAAGVASGPAGKPETDGGTAAISAASSGDEGGARARSSRSDRPATSWPIWALAGASIVAGIWLLIPRRRRGAVPAPVAKPSAPRSGDHLAPSKGQDSEELWAAAAMLGEAIGRIKRTGAEVPIPEAEAPAAAAPEPAAPEPWRDASAAPDPVAPPAPDEASVQPEPPRVLPSIRPDAANAPPVEVTCQVSAQDPDAAASQVLDFLSGDPRVLAKPAPQVSPAENGLDVSFRLLPGLPERDRALLQQQLRDLGL